VWCCLQEQQQLTQDLRVHRCKQSSESSSNIISQGLLNRADTTDKQTSDRRRAGGGSRLGQQPIAVVAYTCSCFCSLFTQQAGLPNSPCQEGVRSLVAAAASCR
jgi:hypothetical protein